MPLVVLFVIEAVCRVPKLTSVCMDDWMRSGSIEFSIETVKESVDWGTRGTPTEDGGHVPAPKFANPLDPKLAWDGGESSE